MHSILIIRYIVSRNRMNVSYVFFYGRLKKTICCVFARSMLYLRLSGRSLLHLCDAIHTHKYTRFLPCANPGVLWIALFKNGKQWSPGGPWRLFWRERRIQGRIRLWQTSFQWNNFWRLVFTLDIRPAAGTPKWHHSSSWIAMVSTLLISSKP